MQSNYEKQRSVFRANPSNASAGDYMSALREMEAEGDIDDDEWLDGLAEINDYLCKGER